MLVLYRTCLVLCMGLYCSISSAAENTNAKTESAPTATAELPRPALPGRNVLAAQAIQLSADAEQLIDLTTPVEHFSALFLPANTAQPRGTVILLPGAEESFDEPITIGPLRRKLPDAGWHTLSLNLPDLPLDSPTYTKVTAGIVAEHIPVLPPEPLDEETPNLTEPDPDEEALEPEPEDEEEVNEDSAASAPPIEDEDEASAPSAPDPIVIPAYPERVSNFIDAAIAYAQSLNSAEIILLGHHEGAHWALNYPHPAELPLRSVLIAPRPSTLLATSLTSLIEAREQPIADFYHKSNPEASAAAQQRSAASRRAGRTHYTQINLSSGTGVPTLEQEHLLRRVKGWLNKAVKNP